jgi:hypothetical protein
VKRMLKPVTYVLAALYFLVDAAFMAIAKPISDWLARHVVLRRLRAWIKSLRPYPSLALFSVPVIMLEPVKPVAAYLAAGQADENSNLCVGIHKIPRSQGMAGSHRGLASHSCNKQRRPPLSDRDKKIRCGGVSAVLKTAVVSPPITSK